MKSLTLPLSALLIRDFYFSPTLRGGNIYIPKGDPISISPRYAITHVVGGNDDQYQVFYTDGSNLKFGQDEPILISDWH